MNHLHLGFLIGLFGSFHCVGMCGPLAFALTSSAENKWQLLTEKLNYNFGRCFSYALLGLLIGLIGKQLWLAGVQQYISIISGSFILLAAFSKLLPGFFKQIGSNNFLINPIQNLLINASQNKSGHFFTGMLNGLLPCGFVYLAIATAINTNSVVQSSLFIFCFGLGTIPLMLAATMGINFAKPVVRKQINSLLPVLMLFLGAWFILRGFGLGIPYLSPEIGTSIVCK